MTFKIIVLAAAVLLVAGCGGFLRVSDEQIDSIANRTGEVAGNMVRVAVTPLADPYAPGAGAAAGGVTAIVLAGLTRALLKLVQKKKADDRRAIAEAVKNGV